MSGSLTTNQRPQNRSGCKNRRIGGGGKAGGGDECGGGGEAGAEKSQGEEVKQGEKTSRSIVDCLHKAKARVKARAIRRRDKS